MTDAHSIMPGYSHAAELLRLLKVPNPGSAIRKRTHARPLLVFWVAPDGSVLDAHGAHHAHPPGGEDSMLADPQHKGHLRGRAASAESRIYAAGPDVDTARVTQEDGRDLVV